MIGGNTGGSITCQISGQEGKEENSCYCCQPADAALYRKRGKSEWEDSRGRLKGLQFGEKRLAESIPAKERKRAHGRYPDF